MGHVALRSSDAQASIDVATRMLGLRVTGEDAGTTFLSANRNHHELIYIEDDRNGVDRFGLVAADEDALDEARHRVAQAGFPIVADEPIEAGLGRGFTFVGPDGFVFEIYLDMPQSVEPALGFGPDRYGHINLHAADIVGMRDFLVGVLGFMVSDVIGDGELYFLRCNAEHHGIALGKGRGVMHHHAWQAQSIVELGKLNDRLDAARRRALWGPVRHGAGHNIATYFAEPGGSVVELYTDMEHIYDPHRPANTWPTEDGRWYNRWGVYIPAEFRDYGIPPITVARGL
ncbi:VOC family protein [Microbacterium luticocti]|uniref:VOC family protein n=1 Tax=Microbacterium luticocti TaxID=451764 RepID=UPI00048ADB01|nr:VOC family protein [Microbacterium luticocti]